MTAAEIMAIAIATAWKMRNITLGLTLEFSGRRLAAFAYNESTPGGPLE
jgi:hypothetical protein